MIDSVREMYRAIPGLVVTVAVLLAFCLLLGILALAVA